MKKLLKVLLVLAAIVGVLLLVGTILLHVFLPPEKAKALVLDRLSAQLHRQVEVGSVSVGLLSGLQMSQLKISESPTFAKGTFISSDEFTLKVALPPLLFRKVIVRQIILKHPVVSIVRAADGKTFNFSDLTDTAVPATPGGKPAAPAAAPGSTDQNVPFALLVSRAEIQKGEIHFVDHSPAQQSAEINPLNLLVKNVSLLTPFSMQTDMRVKTQGMTLGANLAGQANLLNGSFKITSGGVDVGPAKATFSGMLTNLKTSAPACKLHIETNKIPIREALKFAPPNAVPPGIVLDGSTSLSADVSGTAAQANFAAKWDGTDLLIAKGDDFAKPTGVPLQASVIGSRPSANQITIQSMNVKLAGNELTGSGIYRTAGKQDAIDFVAKGTNWSLAELAKLSPTAAPYHPTGTISFAAHATGSSAAPVVNLQSMAHAAMASVKQENYEGQNLALDWNLTDITADLSKVSGTASLKQGPGKIINVEKLAASNKIGRIVLAPLTILAKLQSNGYLKQVNLPSMQTIPFDSILGDYLLKTGIVDIKTFSLNGKDLSIVNQGTVGLAGAQPIHLNVLMKLAVGSIGGTVGELLKDESGRPTVKFTANGTADNPVVKLDLQDVKKKALQQVGQEILKNKDVQNAVGDLQNTLKGIFH